jgi:cell division septation protein DedD
MGKIIMVALIVVVMLAGLGAGVYLVQQNQELVRKAAPATTLSFSLVGVTPKVGDNFVVASNIDTGDNQVIAVELHLNFDPTRVEFVQANPGPFFSDFQSVEPTADNSTGTVTYSLYLSPQTSPLQGQGIVATFTFRAKTAGSTTISYSPETIVGAVQEQGQNVLVSSTPLTVNIEPEFIPASVREEIEEEEEEDGMGGQIAQVQSTATPTPTLVATATLTPTAAITTTLTPTTAATATLSPTSASSPTATPSAFDTASLPDSGFSLPTILLAGFGLIIVIFSLAFL